MTPEEYNEAISATVQSTVNTGISLRDVLGPLLNMAVSTTVNVCHNNGLDIDSELDLIHMAIDQMAEIYKEEYEQRQPVHRTRQ